MNKNLSFVFFLSGSVLVVLLDQLTKWWARGQGIVTLNAGISLSLFVGLSGWIYALVTIVLLGVIGRWLWRVWREHLFVWGILCGAALSNALDRLLWGGVQDFLPIPFFHLTNNLADWMISGILVWVGWKLSRQTTQQG